MNIRNGFVNHQQPVVRPSVMAMSLSAAPHTVNLPQDRVEIRFGSSASTTKALFNAVDTADLAALDAALASGFSVDARSDSGETSLHRIIGPYLREPERFEPVIEKLLNAGAQVNTNGRSGHNPLSTLLCWAHNNPAAALKLVGRFIKAGVDVNAPNGFGTSPLERVVENSNWAAATYQPILRALLKAGANPNLPNRMGLTELGSFFQRAAYRENETKNDLLETLSILLAGGADPHRVSSGLSRPMTPLEKLMSEGVRCYPPRTGLMSGPVQKDWPEAVALVLAFQPDWMTESLSLSEPIKNAAYNGFSESFELLLARVLPENRESVLSVGLKGAVMGEQQQMIDRILSESFNLDAETTLNIPVMQLAASRTPNPEVIRKLVRAGADPNSATPAGTPSPLHFLAMGTPEVDDDGYMPMITGWNESLDAVNALLEAPGIQVNQQDAYRMTPLMYAASSGHVNVVKALLKAGADPELEATEGVRALQMVQGKHNLDPAKKSALVALLTRA